MKRDSYRSIWLGLNIAAEAKVVKDHPDWFLKYYPQVGDDPELDLYFGAAAAWWSLVLDVSMEEVRAYIERTADILLKDWGLRV